METMAKISAALLAVLLVAIVAIGILYSENKELEEENTEYFIELLGNDLERERAAELDACLATAERDAWDAWKLNCTSFKYDDSGEVESCSVPNSLSGWLDEEKQKDKDNCFRRFGK